MGHLEIRVYIAVAARRGGLQQRRAARPLSSTFIRGFPWPDDEVGITTC